MVKKNVISCERVTSAVCTKYNEVRIIHPTMRFLPIVEMTTNRFSVNKLTYYTLIINRIQVK